MPKFNKINFNSLKQKPRVFYKRTVQFIQKRPLQSFFLILLLFLLVIFLGNVLTPVKKEAAKTNAPKSVKVYQIGSAPKVTFQAQIEKSGVVKIMAQTAGIVSKIDVKEGDAVGKNQNLINLASSYDGSNAPALQSAIAAKQYQITKETYDSQKEVIQKQRDVANNTETNAAELRNIASEANNAARSVFDLNQGIINEVDQQIAATPNGTSTQQLRQLKAGLESGNLQLRSQILNTDYTSNSDNPTAQNSGLQKEIALKQLDIQEKTLDLSKELGGLQVALANVNASLMHPVSPFDGVVQRVHVRVGESVTPGTVLITIGGNSDEIKAVVKVPMAMAKNINDYEKSILSFNGKTFEQVPAFVSGEATDSQLYSVIYDIPSEYSKQLTDGSFVTVEIPIGLPDTGSAVPFVPLDTIYQGTDESYLFVNNNGKVESRKVELGSVYGQFVEIKNGLQDSDQVILNRNVIAGDRVTVGE